jgi:polar amino acid transport system substrate-binding protein
MIRRDALAGLLLGLAAAALLACATSRPAPPRPAALLVGVNSDSPPYAFYQGERLVGLEVDFATALAEALGRPLRLVDLEWREQIPALLDGRTDIIMSGMTITRARQVRIAFSEPYLRSGQAAMMRRAEMGRYPSAESVLRCTALYAVVDGTTGERFVRERCPQAAVAVYPTAAAAVTELRQNRADLLIHDAPVVVWFVSGNEAELAMVLRPLNDEPLGWGLRPGDEELRGAVDGVLTGWREDGTLERTLTRWVPYWRELEKR